MIASDQEVLVAAVGEPPRDRTGPLQIAINAVSGVGTRLLMMAVGFTLTPFIIHSLGVQQYGLYAIVGSLAGYLGLLDFGLGGTFVKFITEYIQRGDRASARQVISFGIAFYVGFGLLIAIPIWFGTPAIVHTFKMPAADYAGAITLFRVLMGLIVVSMILGIPGTAVVAMQRMDLASRNNFIGYVVFAISTFAFLKAGWGIRGVVGGSIVNMLTSSALQYATARRVFGPIWHNPLKFDKAIVKRLFAFGGWTQLNSIFNIINVDAGRFIAGGAIGVGAVTYYELGSKLAYFAKQLTAYLLDALMPAASAIEANGDRRRLVSIYVNGTQTANLFTFLLGGFVVGAGAAVMQVWLGEQYPAVTTIIVFLSIGYAANSLTGVGTTILRASGKPKFETYYTAVTAVANIVATVLLAPRFGIVGVAAGTAVGWIVGSAYFTVVYHRIEGGSWWSEVGSSATRILASSLVAIIGLHLVTTEPHVARLFHNRLLGLIALGVCGGAYVLVFAALTRLAGLWSVDVAMARRRVSALRTRLRPVKA